MNNFILWLPENNFFIEIHTEKYKTNYVIIDRIYYSITDRMKKLICGILMLGTIAGVYGQKVMSLEECRLLALENNKKLKMADEQINAAKAKKEEAFTKYLPALDAMGTYMRNQKEINLLSEDAHLPVGTIGQDGKWTLGKDQIMIGADGKPVMNNGQYVPKDYALLPKEAMTVDDRNMALLQVGLTQPIYMGGKIRAYNQLAGLSEKLAESGREQELQNIIQETDEAYWQIVSLVNRQKLAVKFVETLQKFEHDIEVMYRTGVSTKADMLSVKVKLNQAEMALLRVEDGLSLARMNLNQICGLAVDSVYTLQEELLNVLPQAEPKWCLCTAFSFICHHKNTPNKFIQISMHLPGAICGIPLLSCTTMILLVSLSVTSLL